MIESRPSLWRVAFLLPRLEIGGAEHIVLRMAAGLDRRRFDPVVLGLAAGSGRLEEKLADAQVPWVAFGRGDNLPAALWRLFRWLRAHPCDVLFTLMFHANLVGRTIGRSAGARIVISSERVVGWESRARRLLNRMTVHWVDCVTTNSEAGREFWQRTLGIKDGRIRVILNGVDTDRFRNRPKSAGDPAVTIGNLARLHRAHDHSNLYRALAILAARADLPLWRCLIGGDGPERAALERLHAELGLDDQVRLVGHVSKPESFLAELDLYVQTSTVAGLPNAVIEAMATARPVVATAVGGTPEAVVTGTTGLLVPPGDPAALAAAIGRLISNPELRRVMGEAGRARVEERFSASKMIADTESLLDELIQSAR
jgi:glycosyltransferase involved in cell wall biosynthesis